MNHFHVILHLTWLFYLLGDAVFENFYLWKTEISVNNLSMLNPLVKEETCHKC